MNVNIQELFGEIDIYVFDQILRGNIAPGMRILDAGCGYGRNLVYLLRERAEIFAIDANPRAVEHVRQLSKSLNPSLPAENFQVGRVEQLPFPDDFADVVMCSSVLHFARDEAQFHAMLARTLARSSSRRPVVLPPRFTNRHGFRASGRWSLRHARRTNLVSGR